MWYLGFETSVPPVSYRVNDCSECAHTHKHTHTLARTLSHATHFVAPLCAAVVMTAFSPATDLICMSHLHISQHPSEHDDCVTF